jgi:microcompartment protein CcmL/EutN
MAENQMDAQSAGAALGMIETRGSSAMVEAADAMVKAIVSTHVIPRPHMSVDAALPLGRQPVGDARREPAGRTERKA